MPWNSETGIRTLVKLVHGNLVCESSANVDYESKPSMTFPDDIGIEMLLDSGKRNVQCSGCAVADGSPFFAFGEPVASA